MSQLPLVGMERLKHGMKGRGSRILLFQIAGCGVSFNSSKSSHFTSSHTLGLYMNTLYSLPDRRLVCNWVRLLQGVV